MKLTAHIGDSDYVVELKNPIDISIPARFEGERLSAFGASPATKAVYQAGSFTGDVRQGGSCNCEVYTFSPHLHGTHTECMGHITAERMSLCHVLKDSFIPATLATVRPEGEIITREALEQALTDAHGKDFLKALVIRTLPNGSEKKTRDYSKVIPAYISSEAMACIVSLGVSHLIVDLPSVDRVDDAKLCAHRIFWNDDPGRTITELAYVSDHITDGHYLLNLQVAAMEGDAASSRPLLFRVSKK